MKILYLGYFCQEDLFLQLSKKDKDFSIAAHKYETQLLKNLTENISPSKVTGISILSYINKEDAVKKEDTVFNINFNYVWKKRAGGLFSFVAIKEVKALVKKWLKETEGEERIILTYATNFILLYPFLFKKHKVKIVTICSEIPQYRILTGNKIKRWLKKTISTKLNNTMDGYIFFSKYMNEKTNPKHKPFIVVEGLPDVRITKEQINEDATRKEQIFYAGYLIEENGIENLIKAFLQLENKNIELVLCGSGDLVEKIKIYATENSSIKYLGSLPNDKILELERNATLLINPRKADNLLTKYSFPSKTFEYLTSGTPTIITKLDGIPEEYYNYCYTCDSSSVEALTNDLNKVLSIPLEERIEKAKKAFEFIKDHKSSKAQTQKILQFLEEVSKN